MPWLRYGIAEGSLATDDRGRSARGVAVRVQEHRAGGAGEQRGHRREHGCRRDHLDEGVVVHVVPPSRPFDHGTTLGGAAPASFALATHRLCNACDRRGWNGSSSPASRATTSEPCSPSPGARRIAAARSSSIVTIPPTRCTSSSRAGSTSASRRSSETPSRSASRGPGATFGELAVVTGAERSATVTALEPGETLVLRGSELRRLARAARVGRRGARPCARRAGVVPLGAARRGVHGRRRDEGRPARAGARARLRSRVSGGDPPHPGGSRRARRHVARDREPGSRKRLGARSRRAAAGPDRSSSIRRVSRGSHATCAGDRAARSEPAMPRATLRLVVAGVAARNGAGHPAQPTLTHTRAPGYGGARRPGVTVASEHAFRAVSAPKLCRHRDVCGCALRGGTAASPSSAGRVSAVRDAGASSLYTRAGDAVPEGDSLHRAAARLRPLVGERVEASSPNPRGLVTNVAQADRRPRPRGGRRGGKEPAAPVRGRRRPPQPSPDERALARQTGRRAALAGSPVARAAHAAVGSDPVERADPAARCAAPRVDSAPTYSPTQRVCSDLVARLRATDPARLLGDVLVDQRVIAGIGNMWLAELLWHARISPWLAVGQATEDELARALSWGRDSMRASVAGARPQRAVYRRAERGCPRCGGIVRSAASVSRTALRTGARAASAPAEPRAEVSPLRPV